MYSPVIRAWDNSRIPACEQVGGEPKNCVARLLEASLDSGFSPLAAEASGRNFSSVSAAESPGLVIEHPDTASHADLGVLLSMALGVVGLCLARWRFGPSSF